MLLNPVDYAALQDLSDSIDGENWKKKWDTSSPTPPKASVVNTWPGVTVESGRVTEIALDDNDLSGPLPDSLGNLSNLKFLDMSYNDLTGTIPDSLGNLSNLKTLDLDRNDLSGSIPDSLGNLINLKELELSRNSLSGSIPDSLGNLINLKELDLSVNSLSGTIPDSLGSLSNLRTLSLANPPYLETEIPDVNANLGENFNLDVSAHVGDINDDIASYGALGLPDGLTIDSTTGAISGTPTKSGSSTVTVTVSDSWSSVEDEFTIAVLPPNSPPVAMDDSATTLEQTAVTLDVLANDSDPDGNPIQLVGYEAATNGTVTHGTPDSPGKDLLIYTPNSGFTGNDSITYTISDGNAAFDTAEVNITVNSAPEEVTQLKITPSELTKAVEPNTSVSFDVNYSTEPAETPTTGIVFQMHWDSSQVAFDPVTGLTEHFPLGAQPISAVLDDPITNGGLDGDPNTDKYILQAWVDANGNWPNNPNPTLYTANFTALPGFSGTQINFGANSDDLPANSNFVPSSIALTSRAPSPTLDIDGNGVIDALTDGLVAIRYLFGFRGETLTKDVVGEGATSDTSEIVTYLDEVGDMMLDIDGNGTAGALTDGILFLRHALGFSDQALIQGAISEGATRTTATAINEHMQSFSGVVSEGATDPGILDPFSDTQSNDSFYDSFYSFEVL
ncbi:MAG: cadherin-like domain-containing protein [Hormoscilla sp. GM7CHS1pb]|nr:cadherin-like domain-containing protein [Hormoscilla sp. GM7CHS1pb]MBC6481174.1 cadherin-like domain-containing protein [Hormoscilla sp. GM7CHS1pb]MBC6481414.1 cadherin-like domain-containing protein [Hormoscilla sp. GM7CHS1pb]